MDWKDNTWNDWMRNRGATTMHPLPIGTAILTLEDKTFSAGHAPKGTFGEVIDTMSEPHTYLVRLHITHSERVDCAMYYHPHQTGTNQFRVKPPPPPQPDEPHTISMFGDDK